MYKDWLTKRTTVAQAESSHMVSATQLGPDPVPFGYRNEQWVDLLAQMSDSDELWEFRSPRETWTNMAGQSGIALIRNGELVARIITMMN